MPGARAKSLSARDRSVLLELDRVTELPSPRPDRRWRRAIALPDAVDLMRLADLVELRSIDGQKVLVLTAFGRDVAAHLRAA
ncbi:MAG: hypothetical protein PGN13_02785 [Patulibacter minatonensis]